MSDAFYQALSIKCDLLRAKLKLLVCGINTFMQMHPYNANDISCISLHHIKLKFVQALLIQIKFSNNLAAHNIITYVTQTNTHSAKSLLYDTVYYSDIFEYTQQYKLSAY